MFKQYFPVLVSPYIKHNNTDIQKRFNRQSFDQLYLYNNRFHLKIYNLFFCPFFNKNILLKMIVCIHKLYICIIYI